MPLPKQYLLRSAGLALTLAALGCATSEDVDMSPSGGKKDSGTSDTGGGDSSPPVDSGTPIDSGALDTGTEDTSTEDTSTEDTSTEDTGAGDTGAEDTGSGDTGAEDTGSGDTGDVDATAPDTGDDSSVGVDAGDDTSVGDAGDDTGGGGPLKLASGSVLLHGVTTDGFVVYTVGSTTYAVALTGGTPKIVATGAQAILLSNKAVFTWTAISSSTGFGALSVWTDAWGSRSLATSSLVPGDTSATYFVAAASADGEWVAYTDGAAWAGWDDVANIRTAKADGTSVKTVFASAIVYDDAVYGEVCTPYMRFAGSRLVTTHCSGPSGAVDVDVSSFDPATSTSPTTLGTSLEYYPTVDPTGSKVAVVSGALRVVPVAGGAAVTIDTGTKYATFTSDGSAILYLTSGNALKRASTTAPSPAVLASGTADLLSNVSRDDQWLLVTGASSSSGYDVRLASAVTPGTPTVLHAATTGDVFGDAFTADSTHALYYGSIDSLGAGTLYARPVAGGATITLGTGAWLSYAISGSKVLWNDGHVGTTSSGTATLKVRDLASSSGETVIAANADRGFVLSPARDKVVYTYSSGTSQGLWAAPIP